MDLFSHKHHDEPENSADGGADRAFEVVNAAGKRIRFTPEDFDEIFTITEAREMRKHLDIGWLLLDEWVGRDPGRSSSWIAIGLRRSAGRVLSAQDDPEFVTPSDVTTYVLGYLKDGATGVPVG